MNFDRLAETALYVNLGWYALLCVLFFMAGNLGKGLYFLGAAILTIGIILV